MTNIVIFLAKYLIAGPVVILVGLLATTKPADRQVLLRRTIFSYLLAWTLVLVCQHIFSETRPYLALHIPALIANPPTNNSFPSGHTVNAFTAALLVLPFNRNWGRISLIMALLVGIGRIEALVHYPIDVVGGIIIAILAVSLSVILIKKPFVSS